VKVQARPCTACGDLLRHGCLVTLMALALGRAGAVEIEIGEVYGSWDTTFTYGQAYRTADRDPDLIGRANGGRAFSVNFDDGDLNYDSRISHVLSVTSEIEARWRRYGAFVRASAFHDFANLEEDRERTPLTDEAERFVGEDLRLLDAYAWADFELRGRPLQIRIGEQVINWGESTFIQNSINTINPVDVARLRVPGAELREALLPVGMVWGSVGISDSVTLEGFYQYDYERTRTEPAGTFFSTNDFASEGGRQAFLGFGDFSDLGTTIAGIHDPAFLAVPRIQDELPDGGEFGAALRIFAPALNDTEFGFYYINYHSRLPVVIARTGTPAGVGNATGAAVAATTLAALGAAGALAVGTNAAVAAGSSLQDGAAAARRGIDCALQGAATGNQALVGACVIDQYAKTGAIFNHYPENIQLYGVSFNTQSDWTGVALQGEYSFRDDVPLQVDETEGVFAGLTPLSALIPAARRNQLGNLGTEEIIPAFVRCDVSQIQATASKIFGPSLGANSATLIGEIGLTHVHDFPDKSRLRLDGPGTFTSGDPFHSSPAGLHPGKPAESADAFADATSWGYRLLGRFEYDNLIGPVNILPRVAWLHDVQGNSPGPGGNFIEGRKAITLGVTATYQQQWEWDINYTNFFGAGRHHLLSDRDFVAFSLKYSF